MHGVLKTHSEKKIKKMQPMWSSGLAFLGDIWKKTLFCLINPPSHGTNVSYQQCIIWDGWVVNGWMVEYIIEHEVKEENKLILFFNIAKPAHFS